METPGTSAQLPGLPLFLAASLAGAGLEIAAAFLFLTKSIMPALMLHGTALALLAALATWRQGEARSWLRLLLVAVLCTGPFGAILCLLVGAIYRFLPPPESEDLLASLLPDEVYDAHTRLQERLSQEPAGQPVATRVEPFQNILSGGSIIQKQIMIAKITKHFRPRFAPLLLQTLQDPNPAVRVQAATALAKIERDFLMRYMSLEKKLRTKPGQRKLQLKLAELCDSYAHAGLIDESQRRTMRERAIALYRDCLASSRPAGKQQQELRLRLARLYLREERPQDAYELLRTALAEAKKPASSLLLWYIESLFRLRKIAELRRCVQRYGHQLKQLDAQKAGMEISRLIEAWGGQYAVAA
jgi:hypothetical protein